MSSQPQSVPADHIAAVQQDNDPPFHVDIPSHLRCDSCKSLLTDPVTHTDNFCFCTICANCTNKPCPDCKNPVVTFAPANKKTAKAVFEIQVKCGWCKSKMTRNESRYHKNKCTFKSCPACRVPLLIGVLENHLLTCEDVEITCGCIKDSVDCKCKWKGKRRNMKRHMDEDCQWSKEFIPALKQAKSNQQSKIDELTTKLDELTKANDACQSNLVATRNDLKKNELELHELRLKNKSLFEELSKSAYQHLLVEHIEVKRQFAIATNDIRVMTEAATKYDAFLNQSNELMDQHKTKCESLIASTAASELKYKEDIRILTESEVKHKANSDRLQAENEQLRTDTECLVDSKLTTIQTYLKALKEFSVISTFRRFVERSHVKKIHELEARTRIIDEKDQEIAISKGELATSDAKLVLSQSAITRLRNELNASTIALKALNDRIGLKKGDRIRVYDHTRWKDGVVTNVENMIYGQLTDKTAGRFNYDIQCEWIVPVSSSFDSIGDLMSTPAIVVDVPPVVFAPTTNVVIDVSTDAPLASCIQAIEEAKYESDYDYTGVVSDMDEDESDTDDSIQSESVSIQPESGSIPDFVKVGARVNVGKSNWAQPHTTSTAFRIGIIAEVYPKVKGIFADTRKNWWVARERAVNRLAPLVENEVDTDSFIKVGVQVDVGISEYTRTNERLIPDVRRRGTIVSTTNGRIRGRYNDDQREFCVLKKTASTRIFPL